MKIKEMMMIGALTVAGFGCASKILQYERADQLKENKEFEKSIKIEMPAEPEEAAETADATTTTVAGKAEITTTTVKTAVKKAVTTTTVQVKAKVKDKISGKSKEKPMRKQPDLESDVGFDGRRPVKDPFVVGEKVVHEVTYLAMTAGTLTLEVKPFAQVDGRKSYNFYTGIKTASIFDSFYTVNDWVTTLVDYETLVPYVYELHVKESSQLREAQALFDQKKNQVTFWEKKVTKKDGPQENKLEWAMNSYSQNVFSIIFYLRTFQWDVGTEHQFRVTHDKENLIFKAKAIRREQLSTDVGEFTALVIKPEIQLEGKFKPTGDNFIWISDDDRKLVLRIESKIKIGSLTSEIVSLRKGN